MRRKTVLPWLACVIAALIAIPAFASGAVARGGAVPPPVPSTPAAEATVTFGSAYAAPARSGVADGAFLIKDNYFQNAAGTDPQDNVVEINAGEKVSFSQIETHQPHNVAFVGVPPTSCTQLTGDPIDQNTTSPMPDLPGFGSWTGECRFMTGGTYSFVCAQHAEMTGIIEVSGTATPTPTPTVTVTPTPTPPYRCGHRGQGRRGGAVLVPGRLEHQPDGQQRHGPGRRDGELQLPGRVELPQRRLLGQSGRSRRASRRRAPPSARCRHCRRSSSRRAGRATAPSPRPAPTRSCARHTRR